MLNFEELNRKYKTEASFNKMVNLFQDLIERYGFLPSELREGLFFAQYKFENDRVQEIIKSQKEWEKIAELRKVLQDNFMLAKDLLNTAPTGKD